MVNARTIGQGKDIQANFQKNFGKGSNSLIRAAGNTIAAGISAAFGDPAGAVSHGVKAFSEIKNVGNMVLNAKKTNPMAHNISYNVGQSKPINQLNTDLNLTNEKTTLEPPSIIGNRELPLVVEQLNAASKMFENSEYDTGAGYNPQSGVFRDGSNNTVVDNKPTFEDYLKIQTPPTINSNLTELKAIPTSARGKKINYLKFFS